MLNFRTISSFPIHASTAWKKDNKHGVVAPTTFRRHASHPVAPAFTSLAGAHEPPPPPSLSRLVRQKKPGTHTPYISNSTPSTAYHTLPTQHQFRGFFFNGSLGDLISSHLERGFFLILKFGGTVGSRNFFL